jgi:hypothetical protein
MPSSGNRAGFSYASPAVNSDKFGIAAIQNAVQIHDFVFSSYDHGATPCPKYNIECRFSALKRFFGLLGLFIDKNMSIFSPETFFSPLGAIYRHLISRLYG